MRVGACCFVVMASVTIGARADAQSIDEAGSGGRSEVAPGVVGVFCGDCGTRPRPTHAWRLALPLTVGASFGRSDVGERRDVLVGVRPEVVYGVVSDLDQHAGSFYFGGFVEGVAGFGRPTNGLGGGGVTVAMTTSSETALSLSLGGYTRREMGAWSYGVETSVFFGVWMPLKTIALIPNVGVRIDARDGVGGVHARELAVTVQIDPVVVALLFR